jgi:hypothetical protein
VLGLDRPCRRILEARAAIINRRIIAAFSAHSLAIENVPDTAILSSTWRCGRSSPGWSFGSSAAPIPACESDQTDLSPSVLFLCVHNAGRSQMAAGWMRHLAGDRVDVFSGGSEPANRDRGKEIITPSWPAK